MIGNISKSKGFKGDRGDIGPQGPQGPKGDIPAIVLRYDEETGDLYYSSDGILLDKEYVETQNFATAKDVDAKLSALQETVDLLYAKSLVKTVTVDLIASAWVKDSDNQHSQVVSIADVTQYSMIDLQPTAEQLAIFHEKDIAFVAENNEGIVTIYCIGQKPENDYTMQATVTEVEIDG